MIGGTLYFEADDSTLTPYLYKYDGKTVTQITSATHGSSPSNLTSLNGDLFFAADDATHGQELWEYNGTTAYRLADINPGTAGSNPSDLTVLGSELYFAATSAATGEELWRTDGLNVYRVADIDPGAAGSGVADLTPYNGSLYFAAGDGTHDGELWRAGTTVGMTTVVVQADQPTTGINLGMTRVLYIGADRTVNENTPVTLTASFDDGSSASGRTFTYLWQVASNNGQVVASGTNSSFSFTPDDNGPNGTLGVYVVSLTETVKGSGGAMQSYSDSVDVFVKDVPPAVSLGANQTVSEGTAVKLVAAYNDPGPLDTPLSYAWQVTGASGQVIATATTSVPNYVFTPTTFGTYTVTVSVTNKDATASSQVVITAKDVAPVISLPSTASLAEGMRSPSLEASPTPGPAIRGPQQSTMATVRGRNR